MVQLRQYQHDAIGQLRWHVKDGKRRVMLMLPTGGGKCLSPETLILMFDGSVRRADCIVVGDVLMGPDSKPRNVLSVCAGEDEMFDVVPRKGDVYRVNAAHLISVRLTAGSGALIDPSGVRRLPGEMFEVEASKWQGSSKTFRHCAKGIRVGVEWEEREVSLDPYVLGVWLGDGTAANGYVHVPDEEIVQELLPYGGSVKRVPGCWRVWLPMAGLLRLGVVNNKHIPQEYLANSRRIRLDLLAGLLDADGHLNHNGYDFISVKRNLSEGVAYLARSLGLAAYVAECQKGCQTGAVGTYWRVSISGDTDSIPCRVERKRARLRRQKKDALVTGIDVVPAGRGVYHGFQLDGDGRFLLGDFTVTHNTEVAKQIIENATAKGKRVFFVAPRIELIKQTSRRFTKYGIDHGVIQADHEMTDPSKPVQVCSIQTLHRRSWNNFDIIIVDEAHGAAAPMYKKFLGRRNPDGYLLIGLSATPFTKGLGAHAQETGGPLFEALVVGASIPELIEQGFLVDVEVWAPSEPDLSGVKTVAGDYDEKQLGERTNTTKLVGDIVDEWKKRAENTRTVCFAVNIAHSKAIIDQFKAAGVAAEHIDAYTPGEERDEILGRLRDGTTRVVSNVALLAEGFDLPAIGCMILARPTKSLSRYLQMVGRALRPAPDKTKALILDHSGTVRRLGWPTEELQVELDDGRKQEKPKPKPEEKLPTVCPKCAHVKPPGVRACPKCGFEPVKIAGVSVEDGDLQQMERPSRKYTASEKQAIYGALISEFNKLRARKPTMREGWVAHKYRGIVGVWPRGMGWVEGPTSEVVDAYLTHERIVYQKGKEAAAKRRPQATCPRCGSTNISRMGKPMNGVVRARCGACQYGTTDAWWVKGGGQ